MWAAPEAGGPRLCELSDRAQVIRGREELPGRGQAWAPQGLVDSGGDSGPLSAVYN